MKAEWGYIIFFYEHKGSQKTIIEDMMGFWGFVHCFLCKPPSEMN
jgi:hypothetical protein